MIQEFLLVASIHLLAVMSPGPDLAMVMRNSLTFSRKVGIWTAIGIGVGIAVHVAYSLLGIGFLISQSILLFNIIKIAGALYLIYMGVQMLRSQSTFEHENYKKEKKEISSWDSFKIGFLTNVLNPKATLFFLAVFSQVIAPTTSNGIKLLYGVEMMIVTALWFVLVALFLTTPAVERVFSKCVAWVERIMGGLVILLGLNVLFSTQK